MPRPSGRKRSSTGSVGGVDVADVEVLGSVAAVSTVVDGGGSVGDAVEDEPEPTGSEPWDVAGGGAVTSGSAEDPPLHPAVMSAVAATSRSAMRFM